MSQRFMVTVETTGYVASDEVAAHDIQSEIETAFTNEMTDLQVITVSEVKGADVTFEEWYEKNGDAISDKSRKNAARAAWEAGYTASTHDALENVKRMAAKLFRKEEE